MPSPMLFKSQSTPFTHQTLKIGKNKLIVDLSSLREKGLLNDEESLIYENKENMHPNAYQSNQENDDRNRYEIKRYPLNNINLLHKSKSVNEKALSSDIKDDEDEEEDT
jgi:hypothetical protein